MQLAISGGCFYWYYKYQIQVTTRIAIIEKVGAKIQDMKCDAINKDAANALISGFAKEPEEYAKLIQFFGIFLGLSASFALATLFYIRKKYAAIS